MPRRNYRQVYVGVAPDAKSIRFWFNKLLMTRSQKLNVWCDLKDRIIGPFFYCETTVAGPMYLDMLEQFMYPQVAAFQPSIIYQQDGAPPHCSMDVPGSLNATFPNQWIGHHGPICWPPRSPDLTLLDLFLWGYVKDCVFATPVNDIGELRTRIHSCYQWGICRGVLGE